ncbi:MAG: ribonuclease P protein component [Lewinella sp.]|uniref:ribonuclease P protein component n=1 Tax=Lewinella sp. TaxID=2004506 RepID=UPI003D6AAA89
MNDFRFQRGERLKSRKELERLFEPGSSALMQYPFRLVWRPVEEARSDFPIQFTVSVSKRRFKHAVDRNRVKRLVREAYRLRKNELYDALPEDSPQLAWMIIFIGKELPEYAKVDKAMRKLITKFIKQYPLSQTNA